MQASSKYAVLETDFSSVRDFKLAIDKARTANASLEFREGGLRGAKVSVC